MKTFKLFLPLLLSLIPPIALAAEERPNILLVMVDHMGFSDIGCYGGEIRTPTLDALAANGVRLARFFNCAQCCPTRASLMTGLCPHPREEIVKLMQTK